MILAYTKIYAQTYKFTFWLLFCLSSVAFAQISKDRYVCSPCGQDCDKLFFDKPGMCPKCKMALVNELESKPHEQPNKPKNMSANALNNYPTEIAETIYSESKDFPNNTQLSVALIRNGETNYYGMIKENDTLKSIKNNDRLFEIGSITKVFTSTVLASLVERKKIKLTDNINIYYPFTFKDNIKLNFENLANHTSGLPRVPENLKISSGTNPYKNYGEREIHEYLKDLLKLENEPSKTYTYSNLGAGLLGYTLGLSQKTNFQELLQKTIFDKYKMTNSFTNSQNRGNKLVEGRSPEGDVVSNWDFDVLVGGGGIISTTEDLAKFANAQFNLKNKELPLTRKPTFYIDENMKIGLGWHILKSKDGKEFIWHNGGTGGYSSAMAVDVDNKTAVIILSNVSGFNPNMKNIDKICFELINVTSKK